MSHMNIDPALRQAAESVLRKNESLSEFVAASLRAGIARRRFQDGFISRGLASRQQARRDHEYFDATSVHAELARKLMAAR
ncbi:YlcI/YnfO family protein [Paraburkholderia sp. EG287A]|uniref:YlcI/YnfO family protein n=1 Tax=Paraburkholderia sp. EG287A TaxID=3237012 RepID=UPI0034D1D1B0